jgi:predicted amidohydrolase
MSTVRLALANVRPGESPEDSVAVVLDAMAEAARRGARIVAFPEAFVPGYRLPPTRNVAPSDAAFLESAWTRIAAHARMHDVAAVVGTERVTAAGVLISVLVVDRKGTRLGFQDKVQLDPSEDETYVAGHGRTVFDVDGVKLGIVICHEGWRYPETTRAAVRDGAALVIHPHFHEAQPGGYRPVRFCDPANSFHEGAMRCRAAENNVYFASINAALPGSPSTSAVIAPDGSALATHPYGEHGLLIVDLDLSVATGYLARRLKRD